MAYIKHNSAHPDATTQNGATAMTAVRNNFNALRDACILGGGFPGFNFTVPGGPADAPTQLMYKGMGGAGNPPTTEWIKVDVTWTSGNVSTVTFSYSSNSGTAYDVIGIKTIGYDGSNNVISATWSA